MKKPAAHQSLLEAMYRDFPQLPPQLDNETKSKERKPIA